MIFNRNRFKKLNTELSFNYGTIFIIVISIIFFVSFNSIKREIINSVDDTLIMQIELIKKSIETTTEVSIRSSFRASAHSVIDELNYFNKQIVNGIITKEYALNELFGILDNKKIGESGYIFIINKDGEIIYHPYRELIGNKFSSYIYRNQISQEEIFFDYTWGNPGENSTREKSMYSVHYKNWDWYIGVTGYREELLSLIKIEDFEDKILSIKFGDTGYPIVVREDGVLIIHPKLKGTNLKNRNDQMGEVFKKTLEVRNGRIEYYWKNPNEEKYRKKVSLVGEIPKLKLFVAATAYESEFLKPLDSLKKIIFFSLIISLIVIIIITFFISKSITKPIVEIRNIMDIASKGNLSVRSKIISNNEIGEIGAYFNNFIEILEHKQTDLEKQLQINNQITARLKNSIVELELTQEQLLEEERFSNMGRLLARFSHLINTPIGTSLTAITFINDEAIKMFNSINKESISKETYNKIETIIAASELLENSLKRAVELIQSFKLLNIDVRNERKCNFNIFKFIKYNFICYSLIPNNIDIVIEGNENIEITNYSGLLEIVIKQLVSNSINHSFINRVEGSIKLEVLKSKNGAIIIYSDTGEGIPADKKDRIFEPLFSMESDFRAKGIGLNIIYNVVTVNMNGSIAYEGNIEHGIKYIIKVPSII